MCAIFNIINIIVIINIHIINSKYLTSNKNEKLVIFEGIQYQLFNKQSGINLVNAEPESTKPNASQYKQNPESYKSKYDNRSPQYLIFWPTNTDKKKNSNAYELVFINSDHSNKNRLIVTIEKSAHDNYYVLREYNSANGIECPLTQQPDGCGIFDCRQMGDLQLWELQLNDDEYKTEVTVKKFQLKGNVTEEFDKKRTKLVVIDGEIINNRRKHTLDHLVPNFLWINDIRERISVEYEPILSAPLMSRFKYHYYKINLKVPTIRSNNSNNVLRKNFHFGDYYGKDSEIQHSKYYTHVSLHRITVGAHECIEYHSFANVIDRAVLPFRAIAEITVVGPYGPLAQKTSKFSHDFIRLMVERDGYKLPNLEKVAQTSEYEINSNVDGTLTTTIVLRFSYSLKTITGDPICDEV